MLYVYLFVILEINQERKQKEIQNSIYLKRRQGKKTKPKLSRNQIEHE